MKKRNMIMFTVLLLAAWLWQSDTVHALEKNGITYEIDKESGTAIVTDCSTTKAGEVVLPDMVNGYAVTQIGSSAFEYCDQITSIKIPERVVYIEHHAFYNCENLKEISLPSYMEKIESCAFSNCINLEEIKVPIGIKELQDFVFSNTALKEVHIPYTVTNINPWAFTETESLEKIVVYGKNTDIPEDMKLIDESYNKFTVKIEGFAGSVAEKYAQKSGFEFIDIGSNHEHNYFDVIKAATLKKTGWVKKVCMCGEVADNKTIFCPKVTISDVVFQYNGNEKKVAVKVTDTKNNEIDSECYEVIFPQKSIDIGKYTVTVRFKKNYVGRVIFNYRIVEKINLNKPENVKLELEKYNAFKLTWEKVSGADGYKVYYKKERDSQYKCVDVKGTLLKRSNLVGNTKYSFKIVPYLLCNNTAIESSNYAAKSIKTLSKLKAPTVSLSLDSINTINVSWKKVNNAAGYRIYLKKPSIYQIIVNGHEIDTAEYKLYKTVTTTSIQMKNMAFGQKYYIKVQPYGVSNGKKLVSDNYTEKNIMTMNKLLAPSKVSVTSAGKTKVKVSWKKVANAKGYYVYIKKNNAASYKLYKTTTGTSMNIAGLKAKTQYRVKIVPYGVRNGVKVTGNQFTTKKFTK